MTVSIPEISLPARPKLQAWLNSEQLRAIHSQQLLSHGKWQGWSEVLTQIQVYAERITPGLDANNATVKVGRPGQLTDAERDQLWMLLQQLQPWRKGPFEVCDLLIDSEWRSNLKWERLIDAIQPLQNRVILDAGCGNGYFSWRMLAQGAKQVIGIDPYALFIAQFQAIRLFSAEHPIELLAMRMEDLPDNLESFDTVFSMGVLYHRKSPFEHLLELRNSLRPGGELVLETIVIDGPEGMTLLPGQRYASMPNVWLLPSCLTLESWLQRCGFINIRLIDITHTTSNEQRTTESMPFKSLTDFLDPNNPDLTIEGYPAPQRAIILAEKKT